MRMAPLAKIAAVSRPARDSAVAHRVDIHNDTSIAAANVAMMPIPGAPNCQNAMGTSNKAMTIVVVAVQWLRAVCAAWTAVVFGVADDEGGSALFTAQYRRNDAGAAGAQSFRCCVAKRMMCQIPHVQPNASPTSKNTNTVPSCRSIQKPTRPGRTISSDTAMMRVDHW